MSVAQQVRNLPRQKHFFPQKMGAENNKTEAKFFLKKLKKIEFFFFFKLSS